MDTFQLIEGEKSSWTHPGVSDFLHCLAELDQEHGVRRLFDDSLDVFVARAPGRMDVMGGIADYSGSLVLQLPIAEACFAAVQINPGDASKTVRVVSLREKERCSEEREVWEWQSPIEKLTGFSNYTEARKYFDQHKWAGYIAGCLCVLRTEQKAPLAHSISIFIKSDVPEGKGVSSSAAVEVASMKALASGLGVELEGRELALLCQKVENQIVGAPCGVMDQMTSVLGRENKLLALLCRPAEVQGHIAIPENLCFYGIDSGERHSIGGADYGSVRTGTFMGLKIVRSLNKMEVQHLTNLPPSVFVHHLEVSIPETMTGQEFVERFGDHIDAVTSIDRKKTYNVRLPTAHPVWENFRVSTFRECLALKPSSQQLHGLGELMFQSHASYDRMGLGSPGTNLLVELVRDRIGEENNVFGAKITGGGSGGVVCVLASVDKGRNAVQDIAAQYGEAKGRTARTFSGSSNGADVFGCLRIRKLGA